MEGTIIAPDLILRANPIFSEPEKLCSCLWEVGVERISRGLVLGVPSSLWQDRGTGGYNHCGILGQKTRDVLDRILAEFLELLLLLLIIQGMTASSTRKSHFL